MAQQEAYWLYENIYDYYVLDDRTFLTDLLYNVDDYLELLELNRAGEEALEMQIKMVL